MNQGFKQLVQTSWCKGPHIQFRLPVHSKIVTGGSGNSWMYNPNPFTFNQLQPSSVFFQPGQPCSAESIDLVHLYHDFFNWSWFPTSQAAIYFDDVWGPLPDQRTNSALVSNGTVPPAAQSTTSYRHNSTTCRMDGTSRQSRGDNMYSWQLLVSSTRNAKKKQKKAKGSKNGGTKTKSEKGIRRAGRKRKLE